MARFAALLGAALALLGAAAPTEAPSPPRTAASGRYQLGLETAPASAHADALVELRLSVRTAESPGNPRGEPVADADLVVELVSPNGGVSSRRLHPLDPPGTYGAHVTLGPPGSYVVAIRRRSGKPGMDARFPLAVGPSVPFRAPGLAALPDGGALPLATGPVPLATTMRALGEGLLALDAALSASRPNRGDLEATAKALAAWARQVPGHGPKGSAAQVAGFESEAGGLVRALDELAASPSRPRLGAVEQNHCWRCHAAFLWNANPDPSVWPPGSAGAHPDGGR